MSWEIKAFHEGQAKRVLCKTPIKNAREKSCGRWKTIMVISKLNNKTKELCYDLEKWHNFVTFSVIPAVFKTKT